VPDGTTSARVLVTNLHNQTQPLIRYELTDRFTPAGLSAAGFLRATVDGRADDGFRYGDLTVHPTVLTTALLQTTAVREYQVRQRPRGVTVAVVADADFDHRALAAGIEDSLRQAGLTDPEVSITRVDAITRDPLTGKAKRFVPWRGGARLVRKHDQHAAAVSAPRARRESGDWLHGSRSRADGSRTRRERGLALSGL
jgi:phenylacetate-CoA ligase